MKQRKKCCEIHRRCIKKHIHFEKVDLALANVQMHLEKAYKNFSGIKRLAFKIQIKTQERKSYTTNVVNGNIQVEDHRIKHEVEMDPYEKTS